MTCPNEHPHSRHCYDVHKCRCDTCREANAAHSDAKRRRRRRPTREARPSHERGTAVCARCGLRRDAWRSTTLCLDCRDVLTREERKAWAA